MTLPNKLTILRILIVPIMLIISYINFLNNHYIFFSVSIANFINLILFSLASLTDMLDGKIARKYNLITTFGKFADPLADKILVIAAMLILCKQSGGFMRELVPAYVIFIIILREFMVSGIRMLAASKNNEVIAASVLGKIKTASTMISLIVLFLQGIDSGLNNLFGANVNIILIIGEIALALATIMTIVSGIDYLLKSKKVIFESI